MNSLKVYCDGGSRGNPGSGASGFVVFSNSGEVVTRQGKFLGYVTNNQAEYRAVIYALCFLIDYLKNFGTKFLKVEFYLDSELVVKQLRGEYRIKDAKLQPLAIEIKRLEKNITTPVVFFSIPRNQNKIADALVNKSLDVQQDVSV